MRAQRTTALLALVATLAGCATTVTESIQRRELRRSEQSIRGDGALRAAVEEIGATARVRVARERLCTTRYLIEGIDDVTTTRSIPNHAFSDLLAIGGLGGLVVGGVLMVGSTEPTEEDGTPRDTDLWLKSGAIIAGVGALMLIPTFYRLAVTGSQTENRPFQTTAPSGRPPQACGTDPAQIELAVNSPSGMRIRRSTAGDGLLNLDLVELLPAEAFRGPAPWSTLQLTTLDGSALGSIDLSSALRSVADEAWREAQEARSLEGFSAFAAAFPRDPRTGDALRQAEALRRAHAALARDAERAARWSAAGDDLARLENLIAEDIGDGWEAEARCRLGVQAESLAALRNAQGVCARHAATVDPLWRSRHTNAAAAIERHLVAIQERIQAVERAEREAAAAREAEARAQAEAARAAAEAEQARQLREQEALERSAQRALERARSLVGECRAGRASGREPARAAYEALATARRGGRDVRTLKTEVAAACRCTPSCAGVNVP